MSSALAIIRTAAPLYSGSWCAACSPPTRLQSDTGIHMDHLHHPRTPMALPPGSAPPPRAAFGEIPAPIHPVRRGLPSLDRMKHLISMMLAIPVEGGVPDTVFPPPLPAPNSPVSSIWELKPRRNAIQDMTCSPSTDELSPSITSQIALEMRSRAEERLILCHSLSSVVRKGLHPESPHATQLPEARYRLRDAPGMAAMCCQRARGRGQCKYPGIAQDATARPSIAFPRCGCGAYNLNVDFRWVVLRTLPRFCSLMLPVAAAFGRAVRLPVPQPRLPERCPRS
ncbi:hypothetical protein B0H11DRAFT_2324719 [Mycena galericulata]|nr:hypothetical protein B0H11DRAFT_2324719 [Mycena galericulata]